jgi:hypothetical protein
MGYTTEFDGFITIQPPLSEEERKYLLKFSDTRRMLRVNGPYFVGGSGFKGGDDSDVLSYNTPPEGQPGLWCGWIPNHNGTAIIWNKVEKFYHSTEWMRYLIDHFLSKTHICPLPFLQGHILNGRIMAQGENRDDRWELVVSDNNVKRFERPWHASELEKPGNNPDVYEDQAPDCGIEGLQQAVARTRPAGDRQTSLGDILSAVMAEAIAADIIPNPAKSQADIHEEMEASVRAEDSEPIIRSCGDCKHYYRRCNPGEDWCNKFKAHYSDWAQLTTKEARLDERFCGIKGKSFCKKGE